MNDLQVRDERRDLQLQTALENVNGVLEKMALPDPHKKKSIGLSNLWGKLTK